MIVNLTPHVVAIHGEDGSVLHTFRPDGPVARLETTELGKTVIDGIIVPLVGYGTLASGPLQQRDTYYIVSLPTALAERRSDFLIPYDEVRDEEGRIIGCRALAKVI